MSSPSSPNNEDSPSSETSPLTPTDSYLLLLQRVLTENETTLIHELAAHEQKRLTTIPPRHQTIAASRPVGYITPDSPLPDTGYRGYEKAANDMESSEAAISRQTTPGRTRVLDRLMTRTSLTVPGSIQTSGSTDVESLNRLAIAASAFDTPSRQVSPKDDDSTSSAIHHGPESANKTRQRQLGPSDTKKVEDVGTSTSRPSKRRSSQPGQITFVDWAVAGEETVDGRIRKSSQNMRRKSTQDTSLAQAESYPKVEEKQ